jgi:hypothetical protein
MTPPFSASRAANVTAGILSETIRLRLSPTPLNDIQATMVAATVMAATLPKAQNRRPPIPMWRRNIKAFLLLVA